MTGSKGQSSSVGNGYCTIRNNNKNKTNKKKNKTNKKITWNVLYKAHRNSTVVTLWMYEKHCTIKKLCLKMLHSYLFYILAALRERGNITCLLTSRLEYGRCTVHTVLLQKTISRYVRLSQRYVLVKILSALECDAV